MLSNLITKAARAFGDVFEFGLVEAMQINAEVIPEAERSSRRIIRKIARTHSESDYAEILDEQEVLANIVLGRAVARNEQEAKDVELFTAAIVKKRLNGISDEARIKEEALNILKLVERERRECDKSSHVA